MAAVRIHIQEIDCTKLYKAEKDSTAKTPPNLCIGGNFEVKTLVGKIEALD